MSLFYHAVRAVPPSVYLFSPVLVVCIPPDSSSVGDVTMLV